MADEIDINKVLPQDMQVLSANWRSFHWRSGVVVASLLIIISFGMCWFIVLRDAPHLEAYRDKAWFVIVTLTSDAGGFLFGKIADSG